MKYSNILLALYFLIPALTVSAAPAGEVIDRLDLSRPGLELVAQHHREGNDSLASLDLLDYFRHRTDVKSVGVDPADPKLSDEERRWADEGLEHKFFAHSGYQPSYFYGDDIDWQYWPVKDNELRWQLHRTKWWVPMGKTYRVTGDEKYAIEWMLQYRDWIKKNPLTSFDGIKDSGMEEVDNVYFAWRPLEVCDRLEHQIEQFDLFLPSPNFTADFLIDFLDNYHRHADFANSHYSAEGNHLLFEAQRVIYAACFFPEFKDATIWRKTGVDILNREIGKQILPDGVQYELDPGYHLDCVNIFGKALRMMNANGYHGEFSDEYMTAMEKMMEFTYNMCYPDFTMPLFSDSRQKTKRDMMGTYNSWLKFFPENNPLLYFTSEGEKGALPGYNSKAFPAGGFYILRNGWTPQSTMMILKAGPEGEWHNQFDNGTFELWANGRNFFPDSGSFIYGGDEEVLKQREWFRRTAAHNTLTLDGRTLATRVSQLLKWETGDYCDLTVVETPGYEGLTHRRAVFFVEHSFFVIADEAYGEAKGNVALNYHLLPSEPIEDKEHKSVSTSFADGNNITLQVFGAEDMTSEEGWTSPLYRVKYPRPAYAFHAQKSAEKPVRLITVIYPADAAKHDIKAEYTDNDSANGASLEVSIDGKKYPLSYTL